MTSNYAIQASGLTKSYGGQEVLRRVDLTVPRGSIFSAARRMLDVLEERGWTGWTMIERVAPPVPC